MGVTYLVSDFAKGEHFTLNRSLLITKDASM
jgi:hypothetical protein